MTEHNFTEGAEPDSVRLNRFVAAMPERDRLITELRYGLNGSYSLEEREIASILRTKESIIRATLERINSSLRNERLIDAAEESMIRVSIETHPPLNGD